MMICKECYIPMMRVISFSKDKNIKFFRCPKCGNKTKPHKIRNEDLNFREAFTEL